jgi:predicted nucleic acid-binding protein
VPYLIDTDWLIDVSRGRPQPTRALDALRFEGLAVSIVSFGELFEGAFGYPDTDARLARISALLRPFKMLPLTRPIMEIFGRNRSEMRRADNRIPDLDLLIGATAMHYGLILITRNLEDFERVPGLRIYQPT